MMRNLKMHIPLILSGFFLIIAQVAAHPTGNIVLYQDDVYWPYVWPVDDSEHHACVMKYSEGEEAEVFFRSKYEASDFMLYADSVYLYLLERRYIQSADKFEFRVLRYREGGRPEPWWDWTEDEWRVGEGGFSVESESSILFVRYPEMYRMKADYSVEKVLSLETAISSMRPISATEILLKTEKGCRLINRTGETLRDWEGLTQKEVSNAPLGRNVVFDADYSEGNLVYAYWGGRTFQTIDANGKRSVLLRVKEPYAPHWVAISEKGYLLFSSAILPGQNLKPSFQLITWEGEVRSIWSHPEP